MKTMARMNLATQAMTVAEFIAELGKHPPDAAVILTWEGTDHVVTPESFRRLDDSNGDPVVLVDAEGERVEL